MPSSNILHQSAENIMRNWTTAIPAIVVMAIVLTMFSGLFTLSSRAKTAIQNLEQKFSITVYLKDNADPFETGALITELEKRGDIIKPVTYTSKEEAWKLMSKTFSLDTDLLNKYKFSLPASLTITPKNPANVEAIEAFLNTKAKNLLRNPYDSKDKQKNITYKMTEFIQSMRDTLFKTIVLFILFFVIGGTLLLSSTIHLAILSRRREIAIMKLIGAHHSKIILPFVGEGVILSILAYILNLILLSIIPFGVGVNVLLFEFIVIVALGALASYLAARIICNIKN